MYKATEKAKHYIEVGAQKASNSIQKGSIYLKRKIKKKPKPSEFSESVKNKTKLANTSCKMVFQVTDTAVKGLVAGGEEIVKECSHKIEKSEKG